MPKNILEISTLHISAEGKKIVNGIDLSLEQGKVHVLMGPNGSGKSTLAQTIMGHGGFSVDKGGILFEGKSILDLAPDKRAKKGIFLSFQYPSEIPGVTISNFLRMAYNKKFEQKLSPVKFRALIKEKMTDLGIDKSFLGRYLNEGFSGGEKKRMEILQMLVLQPKLAILDETDSGLDIDAIKIVSEAVNKIQKETKMTVLLITHYSRILKYIEPHIVYIMGEGKIVQTGGKNLAHELEEKGYAPFGE